jgi:hypothetical protein
MRTTQTHFGRVFLFEEVPAKKLKHIKETSSEKQTKQEGKHTRLQETCAMSNMGANW